MVVFWVCCDFSDFLHLSMYTVPSCTPDVGLEQILSCRKIRYRPDLTYPAGPPQRIARITFLYTLILFLTRQHKATARCDSAGPVKSINQPICYLDPSVPHYEQDHSVGSYLPTHPHLMPIFVPFYPSCRKMTHLQQHSTAPCRSSWIARRREML